jgi:hypothetical protein
VEPVIVALGLSEKEALFILEVALDQQLSGPVVVAGPLLDVAFRAAWATASTGAYRHRY